MVIKLLLLLLDLKICFYFFLHSLVFERSLSVIMLHRVNHLLSQ